jgi:hypothetical protein
MRSKEDGGKKKSQRNEKIGSDSVCVGIRKFPFDSRGRREIVLKILEIDESNPILGSRPAVNKPIFVGILHKNRARFLKRQL